MPIEFPIIVNGEHPYITEDEMLEAIEEHATSCDGLVDVDNRIRTLESEVVIGRFAGYSISQVDDVYKTILNFTGDTSTDYNFTMGTDYVSVTGTYVSKENITTYEVDLSLEEINSGVLLRLVREVDIALMYSLILDRSFIVGGDGGTGPQGPRGYNGDKWCDFNDVITTVSFQWNDEWDNGTDITSSLVPAFQDCYIRMRIDMSVFKNDINNSISWRVEETADPNNIILQYSIFAPIIDEASAENGVNIDYVTEPIFIKSESSLRFVASSSIESTISASGYVYVDYLNVIREETDLTTAVANIDERLTIIEETGGGSGIPDAPEDGKVYGRQDGAWEPIDSANVDLTGYATSANVDSKILSHNTDTTAHDNITSKVQNIQTTIPSIASSTNMLITQNELTSGLNSVYVPGAMIYRGMLPNAENIKAVENPASGDYYQASDTGSFWIYNGIAWEETSGLSKFDGYTKEETDIIVDNVSNQFEDEIKKILDDYSAQHGMDVNEWKSCLSENVTVTDTEYKDIVLDVDLKVVGATEVLFFARTNNSDASNLSTTSVSIPITDKFTPGADLLPSEAGGTYNDCTIWFWTTETEISVAKLYFKNYRTVSLYGQECTISGVFYRSNKPNAVISYYKDPVILGGNAPDWTNGSSTVVSNLLPDTFENNVKTWGDEITLPNDGYYCIYVWLSSPTVLNTLLDAKMSMQINGKQMTDVYVVHVSQTVYGNYGLRWVSPIIEARAGDKISIGLTQTTGAPITFSTNKSISLYYAPYRSNVLPAVEAAFNEHIQNAEIHLNDNEISIINTPRFVGELKTKVGSYESLSLSFSGNTVDILTSSLTQGIEFTPLYSEIDDTTTYTVLIDPLLFDNGNGITATFKITEGSETKTVWTRSYIGTDFNIAPGYATTTDLSDHNVDDTAHDSIVTNFSSHIASDLAKWNDYYSTERRFNLAILENRGVTLSDTVNNIASYVASNPYVVTNELGCLLDLLFQNINSLEPVEVYINGENVYSGENFYPNTTVKKSFILNSGDTIYFSSLIGTALLTDLEINSDSSLMKMYQSLVDKDAELENRILDLQASISNKILDGTSTDILDAAQGAGYIVSNPLGARITGKGLNLLLGSTGVVNVNASVVYDNNGLLSLLAAVPVLVYDVKDGDVITASGMGELTFQNYISA